MRLIRFITDPALIRKIQTHYRTSPGFESCHPNESQGTWAFSEASQPVEHYITMAEPRQFNVEELIASRYENRELKRCRPARGRPSSDTHEKVAWEFPRLGQLLDTQ